MKEAPKKRNVEDTLKHMHCCSGIAKQFAAMWFGTAIKVGLLSRNHIPNIDEIMATIKAPNQIYRLTRAFSERAYWKAREWEN